MKLFDNKKITELLYYPNLLGTEYLPIVVWSRYNAKTTIDDIFRYFFNSKLAFDPIPVEGSSNLLTSGTIYTALTYKVDKTEFNEYKEIINQKFEELELEILSSSIKDFTITAGDCLHISTSDNSSDLSQDITINHDALSSAASFGTGSVLTGLTVDSYGHVSAGTSTNLIVNNTWPSGGQQGGISYYVDSINWDTTTKTQLNVSHLEVPAESGKVKIVQTDTADYLVNKVLSGTSVSATNIYGVTVTNSGDHGLFLTVKIDTIDGGTF